MNGFAHAGDANTSLGGVRKILFENYDLQGSINGLPGEHDLNFKIGGIDGKDYLLKLHADDDDDILDMQVAVLEHLNKVDPGLPVSRAIPDLDGNNMSSNTFEGPRKVRLLTWLAGDVWAKAENRGSEAIDTLGALLARLDKSLESFQHPGAQRSYDWDIAQASKHLTYCKFIDDADKRQTVAEILNRFVSDVLPRLQNCPRQVIHNDANDYNVLLDKAGRVSGLLDFGDMVESYRVVEIAVASAYALIGTEDPIGTAARLAKAYHQINPITEDECDLIVDLIKTRYAVSICMAAKQIREAPENHYLLVSQEDVWRELRRVNTENHRLAVLRLRAACGLAPIPKARRIMRWLEENAHTFAPVIRPETPKPKTITFDFTTSAPDASQISAFSGIEFDAYCDDKILEAKADFGIGLYGENRTIYKSDAFETANTSARRSIHLGIDLFTPALEPVYAPLKGTCAFLYDDAVENGFGPTVLLEHKTKTGDVFWTLYGHLSRQSFAKLKTGQKISRGQAFAEIGRREENGSWPPHLHFQLVTDHLGLEARMHGVGVRQQWSVWRDISPDPSVFLGLNVPAATVVARDKDSLIHERHAQLGRALSIAYQDDPLNIVSGDGCYLIDETGKRWLDMVNNVCHVGHCHPRVVKAAQQQIAELNTNSRYLHDNLVEYSNRLASLFPDPLNVCYFVNSGSEANDLAIRIARAHTGNHDLLTVDHAYHGHLSSLIDVSPYKFAGNGGSGRPKHVRVTELPDLYRGRWRYGDMDAGKNYAADVHRQIEGLAAENKNPALFFSEGILGTGGQLTLPDGYLKEAYAHVRAAGGLCLADEVQVGFGRVGSHMWAFEAQDVVPDIVTLGKPIGNGHPMAAVITTPEIAASFANGMEYFNTFGGNPVSAATGLAVLDVIRDERLQDKCLVTGNRLMDGARELAEKHPLIGDVRGMGLFIGIELVKDRKTLEPAAKELAKIIQILKEDHAILLSSEGPFDNVLKIKPPAQFGTAECDHFLNALDDTLGKII
ncbi:aminotransferase class III-fold pyridoxal phosphate-dependent enzyme [Labrenzia sp. PHM005]|uniref:aminotransferase class III-fold pyridoxal phosphate-dependent enzyme n=1 Tax=Labrenzia sp. PHM005 TaxID=2590016 RepID=UPI001140413D|nr:aminotransferase class III-fold pyridoxal phosphate-dependent enzyme [Labrenzia sp. PHM005]QDG74953.1 aminotransferase class III-fold pyridoxal phosphate-dependent enzyme [Labrenzia sp. PHM005]